MNLTHILVFTLLSLVTGAILYTPWRKAALLICSLLGIFWLQPSTPIRFIDFWLPFASLSLTIMVWAITNNRPHKTRSTLFSAILIVITYLAIGSMRYLGDLCCLTPTRPPAMGPILIAGALVASLSYAVYARRSLSSRLAATAFIVILVLFVILKSQDLYLFASQWLRGLTGQDVGNAGMLDLPWLGFSYLAFRLLHVLQDFRAGRLSTSYALDDFVIYALFFPTLTAGPIDRIQRFVKDLSGSGITENNRYFDLHSFVSSERFLQGGWRLVNGLFKKFVLADSLALISLNAQNAIQIKSTPWAWVVLYAYALRIYYDFSGYTDIALGLGKLLGIDLPDNFTKPYLKTNLTAFWNSWHITLAQWFRAYFFNPLTRTLRSANRNTPTWLIVLIGQFSTMVLIGLWHGITWNFVIWGAWHGIGLFIHNRWTGWTKGWSAGKNAPVILNNVSSLSGWLLTFNYVTLGWVWFALPDIATATAFLSKLAGG